MFIGCEAAASLALQGVTVTRSVDPSRATEPWAVKRSLGPVTARKCLDPLWEGNSTVAVLNASVSILRTDEEAATQVEDLLPNALRAAPETVPLIAFTPVTAGPQNSTSRRLAQLMLHQHQREEIHDGEEQGSPRSNQGRR
jgi:hypothetical protein